MTRAEWGFLLAFLLLIGLAGRVDMQADQRKKSDLQDARTEMAARAAEDKCGEMVAVKRGDRWSCVPLKRSM